jgi:predicted alpha/beta superfamily hydrolase
LASSLNGGDGYRFDFAFDNKNAGTYREAYTGFDGALLLREGNFTLQDESFSFLPENIINNVYHLNFKTAVSTLTVEESPIIGENFEMNFFQNNYLVVKPSNLLPKEVEASYSVASIDSFTLEISGVYSSTKHPYKLTAHFDSLTTGTFTLNIDDGKVIATGDFDTIKITPIDKASLKGNFVGASAITSINTKITYPYNVYLPPNYQTSGKNYPVIYVTDGQWYSGYAYLLDKKMKDVIMVSIDQGPKDRRMIDFLPDGAPLYTKFLKEELIPLIESTYRTNSERTFTGVSAGGLLGAYLLSIEPVGIPYFKNYILIDGSLFAVTPAMIAAEEARFKLDKSLAINLILAGTPQGNGWFVNAFEQRYRNRNYSNLQIFSKEFRVTHDEMGPLAFDDLIDRIY